MLAAAFCGVFIRTDFLFLFGAIAAICGIGLRLFGKKYSDFLVLFIAAAVGFFAAGIYLVSDIIPATGLTGQTAEISGVVTEVSAGGGNPIYTVETDYIGIEGAPQKVKIKLSGWEDFSAKPYDKVSCEASFAVYGEGDFEEILSNRSRGISVYAYAKTPMEVTGEAHQSLGYFVHLVRESISDLIYSYFLDWHAPFMDELLIGNKGGLDNRITEPFRKSGMSHILAISGTHMVIIIGVLEKLLFGFERKQSKDSKTIKYCVLILSTAAYIFIGGLGASVLRAGFMLIISYMVKIFFSGSKSVDNLGLAIIAVVLIDPTAAYDIGFLMSVFACLGIAVFARPFKEFLAERLHSEGKRFAEISIESFATSAVASLAVLPVSVLAFGEISLIAPVANLFATLFAQYSLIFGIVTVLFGFLPVLDFAAGGTAFLAMLCDSAMLKIAEVSSSIPFAYIDAKEPWVIIWIIGAIALFALPALFTKGYKYIKYSAAFCAAALIIGIFADGFFFSKVTGIDVIALEHGTAVRCSKGKSSVLIAHNLSEGDEYTIGSGTYDIISLEPQSGSAELGLLEKSGGENFYFSAEDFEQGENAKPIPTGKTEVFPGGSIEIISPGVYTGEFDGITLLYISEECDIMELEPKFRRADILILDGVSPESFPNIRADYLIFRKMNGYFSGASEIITLKEGEANFFAYGEILRKAVPEIGI